MEVIREGMPSGIGESEPQPRGTQRESWGGSVCLHPTHTADPWDTEEREALTSVTAEVDSLKLIKATGVCGDERSEVGVQHGHPSGTRESC